MTRGGDGALHDHIDDDLEVLIDDPTDVQVCKFNFFEHWLIIRMGVVLVIAIARLLNLQFWLRTALTSGVLTQ